MLHHFCMAEKIDDKRLLYTYKKKVQIIQLKIKLYLNHQ